jgi:hypothetical protein
MHFIQLFKELTLTEKAKQRIDDQLDLKKKELDALFGNKK